MMMMLNDNYYNDCLPNGVRQDLFVGMCYNNTNNTHVII